ncbi:MAG: DNA-binding response regulator, partial [Armatimonadetes bacterium]|nr:DNA-binding response regulator [Armatimonadota bacterium]
MYLSRAGYQVSAADAGPAGVAAARERQPALVLLDIMLPGCDSY